MQSLVVSASTLEIMRTYLVDAGPTSCASLVRGCVPRNDSCCETLVALDHPQRGKVLVSTVPQRYQCYGPRPECGVACVLKGFIKEFLLHLFLPLSA